MTKKPFILITGDDSIRSEGAILVKRVVEKFADFRIVATKRQMSAVGGALNLEGAESGTEIVDGAEATWVDAYPSDAVYYAIDIMKLKPDLVISGVNHGDNADNAVMLRSGTVGVALTSCFRGFPTVAFSQRIGDFSWRKEHDGSFRKEMLEYPGKIIERVVKKALGYKFPKFTFWNINFPAEPTNKLKVVRTSEGPIYPNYQEGDANHYKYTFKGKFDGWDEDTDAQQLNYGNATLTPCRLEFTKHDELDNLKLLFKD